MLRLTTIVSGGQTGVDRAALDAARACGFSLGGWCPRGRRAEDGPIPDTYPLRETPSDAFAQRTLWNVRNSDATLILATRPLAGGTALTRKRARHLGRPVLIHAPTADPSPVHVWLERNDPATLNVAGPRESEVPGVYDDAFSFLKALLRDARPARQP